MWTSNHYQSQSFFQWERSSHTFYPQSPFISVLFYMDFTWIMQYKCDNTFLNLFCKKALIRGVLKKGSRFLCFLVSQGFQVLIRPRSMRSYIAFISINCYEER